MAFRVGESTKSGCQQTIDTPPKNNLISITALEWILWDSFEERTEYLESHAVVETAALDRSAEAFTHGALESSLCGESSAALLGLLLFQPFLILRCIE